MTYTDTAVLYSRDELIAEIESVAQRRLGITAAALAQAYRAGELENAGRVADVLALINLLPDDDPLFAGR